MAEASEQAPEATEAQDHDIEASNLSEALGLAIGEASEDDDQEEQSEEASEAQDEDSEDSSEEESGDDQEDEEQEGSGEDEDEEEEEPEKDEQLDKSWANLIQKEKEHRQRRQELKDAKNKVADLEQQLADVGELTEVRDFISKFKANPYNFLEDLGLTLEGWTAFIENGRQPTADQRLDQMDRKIDASSEEAKKKAEEAAKAESERRDAAKEFSKWQDEVRGLISSGDYPALAKFGTLQDVINLTAEHFKDTSDDKGAGGEVLSPVVAAKAMDEYLAKKHGSKKKAKGADAKPNEEDEDASAEPEPEGKKKPAKKKEPKSETLTRSQVDQQAPDDDLDPDSDEARILAATKVLATSEGD